MMMHMRSALAVLALASASIILGCSGSSHPEAPPPNIVVSTTASSETVEAGGTVSLTATVGGDPHNEGVTWALNGPGTLSAFTSTSVTYNAPADPLATDTPVSIVAISKADSSKKSTAGITVLALDVSLSASDSVVQAGGSITVDAQLVSDPSGKGVTWSLTPASGAGTLSDATSTSVTYHAFLGGEEFVGGPENFGAQLIFRQVDESAGNLAAHRCRRAHLAEPLEV